MVRARGVIQSPVLVGRDLPDPYRGPARRRRGESEREFEVAQLVAAGLTNRQIAEQLALAPKTISAHVTHILTKLGAARRAEIGAWCATVRQDTPR